MFSSVASHLSLSCEISQSAAAVIDLFKPVKSEATSTCDLTSQVTTFMSALISSRSTTSFRFKFSLNLAFCACGTMKQNPWLHVFKSLVFDFYSLAPPYRI